MGNGWTSRLQRLAHEYPGEMVEDQLLDIPRIAFHLRLALDSVDRTEAAGLAICDLGGGVGMFSVACAALGFRRTVLVDDFLDPVNERTGDSILELHRRHGVEIVSRDLIGRGIADLEGEFDIVTTFDSMEHWHHSPRRLFDQVVGKLKPGGAFVLGAPNCVNLRKRLAVPLGFGKWSSLADWYDEDAFRGHVREPDVDDLRRIAGRMGLEDVSILGRNWLGYYLRNPALRTLARWADFPLRLRPSLCSDIYMTGRKP